VLVSGLLVAERDVVAQARGDADLLDAGNLAGLLEQRHARGVVLLELRAELGVQAAQVAAPRLDLGALAAQLVHIGRGAADVAHGALEAGNLVETVDLLEEAGFGARLHDSALVERNRAERAAAEAAARGVDRKTNHVGRGDALLIRG